MSERVHIFEYCTPKIRNGVIHGVKIIGLESRNGRRYSRAVLREATALYESASVFMLHPDEREKRNQSRSHRDHFGHLSGIHERNGGKKGFGLFGNLHVKMSHPMAEPVIEQVEAGDAKFGLSHNAMCELSEDRKQVLKIVEVNSVDLVDNPGTTESLFEEKDDMTTLKKIDDEDGDDSNATVAELKTILEDVGTRLKSQAAELKELKAAVDARSKWAGDPAGDPPVGKKKSDRLSVLEDRSGEEGGEGPPPIGNTHEAFLDVIRGFSVTD